MINRRTFLKMGLASAAGLAARNLRIPAKVFASGAYSAQVSNQVPLDPLSIPKYVTALPHFAGARVKSTNITVKMKEFQQFILPKQMYTDGLIGDPNNPPADGVNPQKGTYVWGYEVNGNGPLYPGYTVEAKRGVKTRMTYINELPMDPVLHKYITVDQTIHWAAPLGMDMMNMDPYMGPPPAVPHLHGGEVPSTYDGGPDQWVTPNGLHGVGYKTAAATAPNAMVYDYPNKQESTTLWFHDHTLGATRLNVYAGMAAFYFLRGTWDDGIAGVGKLPAGPYEIELAIQDRMFDTNGQLYYPDEGANPEMHPYWLPEFFGNVIVVNGASWPYFEVEPRRYRFHVLDGCNARFLDMALKNFDTGAPGPAIWVIGTDGGLLDKPVKLNDPQSASPRTFLMAPGERYDIIIDFAGYAGQKLLLTNAANEPFPDGDPADPEGPGQIMQFRVGTTVTGGKDLSYNPASLKLLREPMVRLVSPATGTVAPRVRPAKVRQLTLNEVQGENGPLEILVNNSKWTGKREDGTPIPGGKVDSLSNYETELPKVSSTEIWEIVNLTMDAHPIHLHLTQFQLLNRQKFDMMYVDKYAAAFPDGAYIPAYGPPLPYNTPINGKIGGNPDVTGCLVGNPIPPNPEEAGWKDTVIMPPGYVTRIVVRWTPQSILTGYEMPGVSMYSFDPTTGPGYVWHCHIVDHEDNEMMRPYHPVK